MTINSIKGFGIIADDLTGAMDAGAGFSGLGLHPFIKFGRKTSPDSSVIVISTDTRDDDPETAYRKVRRQAHKLEGLYVYKKIDSTLRGNIGREIIAVMDALRFEKAVVCPAFPANGRTVVDGKLLIGGIPVNKTAFAKDPVYPIEDASIPALLQRQTGLPCGIICLEEVDKGSKNVFQKIKNSEQKVVVIDATEDEHLLCIAQAMSMNIDSWLPCGSAGLARQLPLAFGFKLVKEKPFERMTSRRPMLAVVGSRNPISIRQVKSAEASSSIHVMPVEPDRFVDGQGRLTGISVLTSEVTDSIARGKNILITTSLSRYMPGTEELIARLLARIVARIFKRSELSGLFLTGGDIARETCRALGISGIRILNELEPGVIFGKATGAATGDVRIITKAGGFGSDRIIVDSIRYFRGED